jgi:hypothetical protein
MGCNGNFKTIFASSLLAAGLAVPAFAAPRQMENLTRGLVASNVGKGMLVSWRLLGTDDPATEFNLYRDGTKIASIGKTDGTNFLDKDGKTTSKYTVAAVIDGKEQAKSSLSAILDKTVSNSGNSFPYKTLKLEVPASQTMPDGEVCTYTPNDMSTADLDGDGEYELILKWDPSNAHDNSQTGYTGTVFIDAYKLDGTRLWRIDLGKNIRAGAHYTQFQVYDYDGDGKAEMIVKTADGTIDGTGKAIGDKSKDYRNSGGTILQGPEYLTVFRGSDGAAIATVEYQPSRDINQHVKGKDAHGYWGDNYGNRCERYLAATGYLDGVHPSAIFARGYYSSSYVAAYDFDGKNLKLRWLHKSEYPGQGLYGEGNHSLQAVDLDGDGYDEIFFGAAALNHDGTLRYRTGLGHGDAHHISDLDPDLPGLEVWDVHEHTDAQYTEEMRAHDGKIIWGTPQPNPGVDNGRGMAADIDSEYRGFEMWSSKGGGMKTAKGKLIGTPAVSTNFRIYFDGDEYDELLDGAYLTKFDSKAKKSNVYFDGPTALGAAGCNGTKNTPSLVADLFGDWREELVVRSEKDPTVMYIVSTPVTSEHRVYTLMHDATYRTAVASENTAYNQPPHLGYYLPDMVKSLKQPDIYVVGENVEVPVDTTPVVNNGKSTLDASTPKEGAGWTETTNAGFLENGYYNFENTLSSYGVWEIFSQVDAKTTLTIRFANGGTSDRNMALSMNGKSVGSVSFPATGWTTYSEAKIDVTLKAGVNTLKLSSMSSDGGPNVDMFTFGIDGVELYDGTQVVNPPRTSLSQISLFPKVYNPVTGILTTRETGFAEIYVYDMSGAMRMGVSKVVSAGTNQVSLDRDMLPKGVYTVKVKLNGKLVQNGMFKK